jgi:hypothetical protein
MLVLTGSNKGETVARYILRTLYKRSRVNTKRKLLASAARVPYQTIKG